MRAIYALLTRRIEDDKKVSDVMQDFNKKDNDQDRIKKVLQVMDYFNITPKIPLLTKECILSKKFRDMGDSVFLKEKPDSSKVREALISYTKSVAHGEPSSEELAMAYMSRSAVLLHMHAYQECLDDIDRAFSTFDLSEYLQAKLQLRKVDCLMKFGKPIDDAYAKALDMIESMRENCDKDQCRNMATFLKAQSKRTDLKLKLNKPKYPVNIPKLKHPNAENPSASNAVAISYNSCYGRHIVAARAIEPGELIAVEESYAYVLDPLKCYSHCSNCIDCCLALIPCDFCYIAMYCSEKCRTEHWEKFHEIECHVFSVLYEISDGENAKFNQFCIRLIVQAFREFGSIQSLKNELSRLKKRNEKLDPRTQGFDSNMKFFSDKYTSIYSLTTNVDKRSSFDLFRRGVNSCILLYVFLKYSTFFGERKDMKLSEIAEYDDATFIGGLILTHQQIISSNAHRLEETYKYDINALGIAALAFFSLFNHSCVPNVVRYSARTSSVMRALYPIAKGEQIFDNYGYHYATVVRTRRREILLGKYYFYCECLACRDNWLTDAELPTYDELLRPPLQESYIADALKMMHYYIIFISKSDSKIMSEREDILKSLLHMLKILYEHSLYPSSEFSKIAETIRHTFSILGNVHYYPHISNV